jgi:hypothetical protein
MSHYKCVACKTRLYVATGPSDQPADLCPGCGAALQPVGELSEVFGFRTVKSVGSPADLEGLAVQRRDAIATQARLDADRWLDDGGRVRDETVPLPRPKTIR